MSVSDGRVTDMCRSTLTDEQISTLIADINERQPKVCPCCGGANFTPTFLAADENQWECHNEGCRAMWTVEQ